MFTAKLIRLLRMGVFGPHPQQPEETVMIQYFIANPELVVGVILAVATVVMLRWRLNP